MTKMALGREEVTYVVAQIIVIFFFGIFTGFFGGTSPLADSKMNEVAALSLKDHYPSF